VYPVQTYYFPENLVTPGIELRISGSVARRSYNQLAVAESYNQLAVAEREAEIH
jgi:hypothetical protein